jgi:Fe2+ transport system protein FeoA
MSFKAGVSVESLTLAQLEVGDEAVVDHIDLPDEFAHRLMEMGFLPGHTVTAARSAPGGDPRVFRIDGTEVALRRETAMHIHLRAAAERRE